MKLMFGPLAAQNALVAAPAAVASSNVLSDAQKHIN